MNTYYKIANLACTLILLAIAIFGLAVQAKHFLNAPNSAVFFGIGIFIVFMHAKLVKYAKRELKQY